MIKDEKIIVRLTYFWAFVEVALGGFLHLFHLPFTGIIVGAFSIILNVLLAKYSRFDRLLMLKALGIVLAAKFILNPYSPFGAYVAVAFQGVLATFIFPFFGIKRWSILLFSLLTMLENAVQKPLLAFLFFQKEIRIGLEEISRKSLFFNDLTFQILIGIYFFIYIFWSVIIANWAFSFSKKLEDFELKNTGLEGDFFTEKKNRKKSKLGFYFFILAMILLVVLIYHLSYEGFWFFIFCSKKPNIFSSKKMKIRSKKSTTLCL
jgi:hypothetical protein